MASAEDEYTLIRNDHSSNLTINLKDLLEQKELIDVTLVAGRHMFRAHRLVLSAISTYFRQMFVQVPANQQAFVFLSDVSEETLEDLITFIYTGKVSVKQEHLEQFLNTAKALNINGLAVDEHSNSSDVQSPISESFTPSYSSLQYQSTRIIPVPGPCESSRYEPSVNSLHQHYDTFEYDDSNGMNGHSHSDINGLLVGDDMPMDRNDQWNNDSTYDAETVPAKPKRSKTKRAKIDKDTSEYNTVADIRTNRIGQQSLIISGHKFGRHHRSNGYGQQRWQCTRQRQTKCRAAASTMDVNGIVMMKILCAEHKHGFSF